MNWAWWGMGGNKNRSRGVNTQTGVWQGTVIRFIKQPMLFCLLGDCCKTLSTNRSPRCPTAGTPFLFLLPPHPPLLYSFTLLLFPLFSWECLNPFSLCRSSWWIGFKSILFLLPSPTLHFPQALVCRPPPYPDSTPPPPLWPLAHNI